MRVGQLNDETCIYTISMIENVISRLSVGPISALYYYSMSRKLRKLRSKKKFFVKVEETCETNIWISSIVL